MPPKPPIVCPACGKGRLVPSKATIGYVQMDCYCSNCLMECFVASDKKLYGYDGHTWYRFDNVWEKG